MDVAGGSIDAPSASADESTTPSARRDDIADTKEKLERATRIVESEKEEVGQAR